MNKTTFFFRDEDKKGSCLKDAAIRVFKALQVDEWEERDSANYPPDEHYFAGYFKNATVEICDCDFDKMSHYPFYIQVENPSWRLGSRVMEEDPVRIAGLLVSSGFTVFIPDGDWWSHNWDGDGHVYTQNVK